MKKAFTLAELLMALAIVGIISILTVPSMVDNINKKVLTNQLKSDYTIVQQLIDDQLTAHKTTLIEDTEFKSVGILSYLLGSASCTTENTDKCWPSDKYGTINSPNQKDISIPEANAVLLRNGSTLAYEVINENGPYACYGTFWVDVNGPEKPNILGRDFFKFFVTKKGKIVDSDKCAELKVLEEGEELPQEEEDLRKLSEQLKDKCTSGTGSSACLSYIQLNSWKMDY